MNNLKDIILIIALAIISVVDSWAVCQSGEWWITKNTQVTCRSGSTCSSSPCSELYGECNISLCGTYKQGSYYYTNPKANSASDFCRGSTCYWNTLTQQCIYQSRCSTQREADSTQCVIDGKIFDVDPVTGVTSCVEEVSCNWTVSTIPRLRCIDVPASGSIVCKNGECSGLPYSMWWSELRIDSVSTRCGNISHVHTSDTSYTFGSQCDVEERCSNENKCYSEGGTFYIVQECAVGRPVVGNDGVSEKIVPYIVSTGKGSCSEMGYRNENYQNHSGGVGNSNAVGGQPPTIDDDCLVYGIGCPEQDTTNYKDPPNQNPSKCYCEPFDGIGSMSKVTCPDGTVSIYYFSCLEWEYMFSSSAVSQSSSSATPPSSGGSSSTLAGGSSSDAFGQYPQYPEQDGAYKKNVQAALSGEASLLTSIKDILGTIKDYLMGTPALGDDVFSLEVPVDSSTYDTTQVNVNYIDSLLAVIDTANSPIDTSLKAQTGVCPIISANFGAVCKFIPLANVQGSNMQIDTSNIGGFNICAIIRGLIIGFASVVSFIIGARMFRQITIT